MRGRGGCAFLACAVGARDDARVKAWLQLSGGLLVLAGCRQPNPEWEGPAGVDTGATSMVEPATESDAMTGSEASDDEGMTTGKDCNSDQQCPDGLVCGPTGCQQGGDGDPCTGDGDCAPPTAICGPNGVCQDGSEGDPCTGDSECTSPTPICGPTGVCQDGSADDPCTGDSECTSPTPICGSAGVCQDGSEGDPCSGSSDCASGLSCTVAVCG
jgi:hypothetical protein